MREPAFVFRAANGKDGFGPDRQFENPTRRAGSWLHFQTAVQ